MKDEASPKDARQLRERFRTGDGEIAKRRSSKRASTHGSTTFVSSPTVTGSGLDVDLSGRYSIRTGSLWASARIAAEASPSVAAEPSQSVALSGGWKT